MENLNSQNNNQEHFKRTVTLFYLMFIVGDSIWWLPSWSNKLITGREFFTYITSPKFLLFLSVKYILITIWMIYTIKAIKNFEPADKKKSMEATIAVSVAEKIPFIVEEIFVLILIPLLSQIKKQYNLDSDISAMTAMHIGATAITGCMIDIFYLRSFEKWIKFIPFTGKSKVNFGNSERSLMVAAINIFAQIFVMYAILKGGTSYIKGHEERLNDFIINGIATLAANTIWSSITTLTQFRGLGKMLRSVNDILNKLSEKDYSIDMEEISSRDELGRISKSIQEFILHSRVMMKEIQISTESSLKMADNLDKQSYITSEAVEKIIESTNAMSESVSSETKAFKQMSRNCVNLSRAIEKVGEDIIVQKEAVDESSATVEEMVGNIRSVTNILDKNAITVNALSEASVQGRKSIQESVNSAEAILADSQGLLDTTNVIQAIAEQTNLLAMNAAIEAAHAGESGKGFAVVASEIRKLAEDTNKQAKSIGDSLQKLQESIKEISQSTISVQENFNNIFDLTNKVQQQENVIKAAMDEQSSGSEQVLRTVKRITDITISVTDSSKEMIDSNNLITNDMKILTAETEKINVTMEFVSRSAEEISAATENSKNATSQNNKMIEELKQTVKDFKVE